MCLRLFKILALQDPLSKCCIIVALKGKTVGQITPRIRRLCFLHHLKYQDFEMSFFCERCTKLYAGYSMTGEDPCQHSFLGSLSPTLLVGKHLDCPVGTALGPPGRTGCFLLGSHAQSVEPIHVHAGVLVPRPPCCQWWVAHSLSSRISQTKT